MNITTEQLREIVAAAKPTRARQTLHLVFTESGFFWYDFPDATGGCIPCGHADAYNACLALLVGRMRADTVALRRMTRFDQDANSYMVELVDGGDCVGMNPDPLLALFAAFQARPDLFAEAAR